MEIEIIDIIQIIQKYIPIVLGLPFALQFGNFLLCNRYKRAATNINNTDMEIFRSIKLRYTNSARLNIPLADTCSFIEKYFYGKGGPFRFIYGVDRFSGFILCVVMFLTTALYVRGYTSFTRMTVFMAASICFYIFRSTLSTEKLMGLTVSFTRDYLDNTIKHRVSPEPLRNAKANAGNDAEEAVSTGSKDSSAVAAVTQNTCFAKGNKSCHTDKNATDTAISRNIAANVSHSNQSENSDIIEAVLQEFLA